MKNIKISVLCTIIIASTVHSSQERPPRNNPFNVPPRTHVNPPPRPSANSAPNKSQEPNSPNQQNGSNEESSVYEKIQAIHTIFQMAKDLYSLLPGEADQQVIESNKKALEEHNRALAEQREINTARRSFYKCCQNNQGLDVERIKNGLPTVCQDVAMDYAALGYLEEVEKSIQFFNKFRE